MDYLIIDLISWLSEELAPNCPYLEVLRLWYAETVAGDRLDSPRSHQKPQYEDSSTSFLWLPYYNSKPFPPSSWLPSIHSDWWREREKHLQGWSLIYCRCCGSRNKKDKHERKRIRSFFLQLEPLDPDKLGRLNQANDKREMMLTLLAKEK